MGMGGLNLKDNRWLIHGFRWHLLSVGPLPDIRKLTKDMSDIFGWLPFHHLATGYFESRQDGVVPPDLNWISSPISRQKPLVLKGDHHTILAT